MVLSDTHELVLKPRLEIELRREFETPDECMVRRGVGGLNQLFHWMDALCPGVYKQ